MYVYLDSKNLFVISVSIFTGILYYSLYNYFKKNNIDSYLKKVEKIIEKKTIMDKNLKDEVLQALGEGKKSYNEMVSVTKKLICNWKKSLLNLQFKNSKENLDLNLLKSIIERKIDINSNRKVEMPFKAIIDGWDVTRDKLLEDIQQFDDVVLKFEDYSTHFDQCGLTRANPYVFLSNKGVVEFSGKKAGDVEIWFRDNFKNYSITGDKYMGGILGYNFRSIESNMDHLQNIFDNFNTTVKTANITEYLKEVNIIEESNIEISSDYFGF